MGYIYMVPSPGAMLGEQYFVWHLLPRGFYVALAGHTPHGWGWSFLRFFHPPTPVGYMGSLFIAHGTYHHIQKKGGHSRCAQCANSRWHCCHKLQRRAVGNGLRVSYGLCVAYGPHTPALIIINSANQNCHHHHNAPGDPGTIGLGSRQLPTLL